MAVTLTNIETQITNYSLEELINFMAYLANVIKQKTIAASANEKQFSRKLGGLEDGFWMADDFDETPECFKDYV
ncbi:MAG: DUF2281 domain-containing protein [Spirochaetales bacterium]|nr:DUF2281 domain-containing protein [Spirochaetales bacterium]